jgi:hypothetical protein
MEKSVDNIGMRNLICHEKQGVQETFNVQATSFSNLLYVGSPYRQTTGQTVSNTTAYKCLFKKPLQHTSLTHLTHLKASIHMYIYSPSSV